MKIRLTKKSIITLWGNMNIRVFVLDICIYLLLLYNVSTVVGMIATCFNPTLEHLLKMLAIAQSSSYDSCLTTEKHLKQF